MDDLPTLASDLRTAMQSFLLRTGIGSPACEEAPDDLLLVQGPEGFEIDLTVNGAEIRIGSTIAMRYIEVDGQVLLEMIVLDGTLETIGPDGETIVVTTGYRITANIDDEGIIQGTFGEPEFVGTDEFTSDFCVLQNFPSKILNYAVDLDCPGDPEPTRVPNVTTNNTSNIVQRTATRSEIPGVDCSAFDRVGPADIRATVETLEWTEAPGATEYELVFYNYEGNVAQTFRTTDTSYTVNIGEVPTGGQLQWEVRAYKDGEYACVTYRSPVITRGADPNEPPGGYPTESDFSGSWTCIDNFALAFSWSGAESDDTITARYTDIGEPVSLTLGTGSSGSYSYSVYDVSGGGTLRTSSGQSVTLPPITCGSGG